MLIIRDLGCPYYNLARHTLFEKRILFNALKMVAAMGGMSIKSYFYLFKIILYIVLFGQINQTSFLVAYLEYI